MKRTLLRAGALSVTLGGAVLLSGGLASAHVTANVYGDQPKQGGYGAIVFRVPNEEKDAGTVKVEVNVPAEYALTGARTKPVPGWTAEVVKTKLPAPVKNAKGTDVTEAVTKVSWTAQPGNKIAAGSTEYQEFSISAGPLPSTVDTLVLPATQTYENGKVVNWDAPPSKDGKEPDHPAPTVALAKAGATGDHGAHGSAGSSGDGHADAAQDASDDTARWLGGAGLVVGALGLGFGAGATLRARKLGKPVAGPAKDNA